MDEPADRITAAEAPELIARCHPALEALLPKPVPAGAALPAWLRAMPASAASPTLGGAELRTLKQCPPFLDALGLGLLMPLACDLLVEPDGRGWPSFSWDWPFPPLPDQLMSRGPIGLHAPEQAAGAPLPLRGGFALKFMNFWTLEAPPGWSILFTHPLNRTDLPFLTLSGVVDVDAFADGYVHFPAAWTDPTFRGRLPAGTPVAQAIALPRAQPRFRIETQDADRQAATRGVQEALGAEPGVYRKRFRRRGT